MVVRCKTCERDLQASHDGCKCKSCCPVQADMPARDPKAEERRRHLLARMSGNIAPAMLMLLGPAYKGEETEEAIALAVAKGSVSLARAILDEVGL